MTVHSKKEVGENFEKEIKGIGEATERRFHEAGILTFAQLAEMKPTDLAPLLSGRVGITEDNIREWIDEAKRLSKKSAPEKVKNGLHNASFTVDLMLTENHDVRRTNVIFIQKQKKESWDDWDQQRLVQFIETHAGLKTKAPESQENKTAPSQSQAIAHAAQPDSGQSLANGTTTLPSVEDIEAFVIDKNLSQRSKVVPIDEDWGIQVNWKLQGQPPLPLNGKWIIQAHLESMGQAAEYDLIPAGDVGINESSALIKMDPQEQIEPGVYRLVISITGQTAAGTPLPIAAYKDGGMVQFYSVE